MARARNIVLDRFLAVDPSTPARQIRDYHLADSKNVFFRNDRVYTRFGYLKVGQTLSGKFMGGAVYRQNNTDFTAILAFTVADIYVWNSGDNLWDLYTPVHVAGTVAVSGTAVTGTTTAWITTWNMATRPYQIRFGTQDPNAAVGGSVTGWYDVASINSATGITLASSAGTIAAGTQYCLRRTLQGGDDDYFDACMQVDPLNLEDALLITNNIDQVFIFNGTTVGYLTEAPICKYLAAYFAYTLAGHPYDASRQYSRSVWNCEDGNFYDWSAGDAGNAHIDDLRNSSDWLTGLKLLRQFLLAYKERSITLVGLSGADANPFTIEENHADVGTYSGRTVQTVEGVSHLFMGDKDMHLYDAATPQRIAGVFRSAIFGNLNPTYLNRCHAVMVPELDAYLLFTPSLSSENPDLAWLFQYKQPFGTRQVGVWSAWQFAHKITGSFLAPLAISSGGSRWVDVADSVTWAQMTEAMGARDTSIEDVPIFGDENGNVYRFAPEYPDDNGVAIQSFVKTKQYLFNMTPQVSLLRSDVITGYGAAGARIKVYASVDGETWLDPFIVDIESADDILHSLLAWNASGRCVQIMIENYQGSAFVFKSLDIEFAGAGKILTSGDE